MGTELFINLKTDDSMNSGYIEPYFESGIEFKKEQAAFRHYFQCMHKQSEIVSKKSTYTDTFNIVYSLQDNAEKIIDSLRIQGSKATENHGVSVDEACCSNSKNFQSRKGYYDHCDQVISILKHPITPYYNAVC